MPADEISISFNNVEQIINMGGPWIGSLYVNTKLTDIHVIVDNIIIYNNQLFYIKYHSGSKWQVNNYFTLTSYHLESLKTVTYQKQFKMLYLNQFIDENIIELYEAFHNHNADARQFFDISTELL